MAFKPNSRYLEWPRLLDSVALCYLAALLMRVPVCVNDFYEYVYSYEPASLMLRFVNAHLFFSMMIRQEIPYTRVLATVPREMREKLPPELTGIFENNVCLVHKDIHHLHEI